MRKLKLREIAFPLREIKAIFRTSRLFPMMRRTMSLSGSR